VLIGFGLGVLGTIPAVALAVASGGAGHGEYVAARLLFPYTMLLTLAANRVSPFTALIALVQFPLYGIIIGSAWSSRRARRLALSVVSVLHGGAVLLCFSGILPSFS